MPLQPTDVPKRTGIQAAIDEAVDAHAETLVDDTSLHYDSGWVLVPVNGAVAQAYSGREPRIRRIGKTVVFIGSYRGPAGGSIAGSSSTTLDLGSVPAGFEPAYFIGFSAFAGSNATAGSCRAWIDAGGGIRVGPNVLTPYVSLSVTYFI